MNLIDLVLQINTNGFVAVVEPPAEKDYLGKMPSGFKMIAALLGDLDNSDGQGSVFFRQDSSLDVLSRAGRHVKQAFPRDEAAEPTSAVIVTWVNMAARGTPGRGDGVEVKVSCVGLSGSRQMLCSCLGPVVLHLYLMEGGIRIPSINSGRF